MTTACKKSGLLQKVEHKELIQCVATGKASLKKRHFICHLRLKGREADKEEKEAKEERLERALNWGTASPKADLSACMLLSCLGSGPSPMVMLRKLEHSRHHNRLK